VDTATIVLPILREGTSTLTLAIGPNVKEVLEYAIGAFFVYGLIWFVSVPIFKAVSSMFRR